jgi:hypothetical protein
MKAALITLSGDVPAKMPRILPSHDLTGLTVSPARPGIVD